MAQSKKKSQRKKRTPLGAPSYKLAVEERPGYVRRWINDAGNRLNDAREGGYEFASDVNVGTGSEDGNTDIGSRVSRVVGKHEDGSPMRAYLMEIPKEYYEEDQAEKQKHVDQIDDMIRNGDVNRENDDGRYIPKEGIRVK